MSKLVAAFIILVTCFLSACSNSDNVSSDQDTTLINHKQNIEVPTWRTDSTSEYFTIDLPIRMTSTPDLNEGAEIAYSFTQEVAGEMKEFYLMVSIETHKQIKSYGFSKDFNLDSYNKAVLSNVTENLDHFELLESDKENTDINQMKYRVSNIFGSLGAVNIFYKLAIFEGKKAFYQILTWTLDYQRSEFEEDMDKIIGSFNER